jgi:DNA polymerase-3 subunit alpha
VESIISAREESAAAGRPWSRLSDVIKSVDLNAVNKKSVENLIKAGALDRLEPNRAKYMAIYEMLIDRVKRERDSVGKDQLSMFGGDSAEIMSNVDIDMIPPDVSDFTKSEKMNMEKEILGIYLSGHPLDEHLDVIERIATDDGAYISGRAFMASGGKDDSIDAATGAVSENDEAYADAGLRDGMRICFIGIISGKQTGFTKKGDLYARAKLEDRYGSVDILVWPEPLGNSNGAVENDSIVIVRGKVQLREDTAPTILVSKVTSIEVAEKWYAAHG